MRWGSSGGASTVNFYYTRKDYPINFMDGKYVDGDNNPIEEPAWGRSVPNQALLMVLTFLHTTLINRMLRILLPDMYLKAGIIDDACTQPYTFGTMPEGGVTVYAKWHQKQYRVFLHVNYPDGATGNINWGSANQAMNFRISEGGHVSEPTGRDLAGFDFVGWYLDPGCTQVFNGEAYVINEANVTTPYNKETLI